MATIVDIEAQIADLERQIVQLKRRRNALVPFLHLPAELLFRVFKMLQEGEETPNPDSSLQIRALSSTCQQLREAALRTPDIWTTLNCRRVGWAELCAIRAGSMPLHLFLTEDEPEDDEEEEEYYNDSDSDDVSEESDHKRLTPEAVLIAARYFKRAQSASLFVPVYYGNKYKQATLNLCKSLEEPSEILRDFGLHFSYSQPLPAPFLGGSCSSLTSLHLEFCIISELPRLPSLSTLICKSCQLRYGFMASSTELCLMPSLKDLTLTNNRLLDPKGAETIADQGRPLLPLLTRLDVNEDHFTSYSLFSILPLPQQSLAIRTSYGFQMDAEILQGIANYARRFWEERSAVHRSLPMHLRACDFSSPWKWSLTFDLSGAPGQDSLGGNRCESKFGEESLHFFQDILPRVQKATIYAVQVGREWENVDFPNPDGRPLLVGLKEVEFREPVHEFSMNYLLMWLRHRKESGYPITRVVVVRGHASLQQSSSAIAIASEVEDVVWIGPSVVNTNRYHEDSFIRVVGPPVPVDF